MSLVVGDPLFSAEERKRGDQPTAGHSEMSSDKETTYVAPFTNWERWADARGDPGGKEAVWGRGSSWDASAWAKL